MRVMLEHPKSLFSLERPSVLITGQIGLFIWLVLAFGNRVHREACICGRVVILRLVSPLGMC